MKEVLNISLQGISFTIEKDAYTLLDRYLTELRTHYGEQEAEVVNDIEERIAELLIERGCRTGVVQYWHIDQIIAILGRPSQIDDNTDAAPQAPLKRRIYRDTQNAVVAGVCSGLAAYFKMDAVWMRIIFILIAVTFTTPTLFIRGLFGIHMEWSGFLLLLYIILWIIIPPARTVAERCAMRGEPQNVDHIHKKFAQGARDAGNEMWQMGATATGGFFSVLWKVIRFTLGVLLACGGFTGMVTIGIALLGVDMVTGMSILDIPEFAAPNADNILWIKVLGVLVALLPCVGLLYAGLQLCFNFKSPRWRPGLINFIVWLVCLLALIFLCIKSAGNYCISTFTERETITITTQTDTVHVEFPKFSKTTVIKEWSNVTPAQEQLLEENETDSIIE